MKGKSMLKSSYSRVALGLLLGMALIQSWNTGPVLGDDAAEDPAVARSRKTVMMLDDVYKTAVVLITDKYVHSEDDFAAGSAAVAWFDAINKKGWHEVRLLDATGQPYDDANTARDDFDREAIKQLKAGKTFYDQVEEKDGKRVLRAATPVPVVLKKCTMCHEHYNDAAEGEPIGILSYSMPIE
jgi:hypothetical protein